MLKEETVVGAETLPLTAFREHVRLGTGFSDLGAEDGALEAYLRAAIAAIEGRTGKVLLARDYSLTLTAWRGVCEQPLPVAPVRSVSELRLVDAAGQATLLPAENYRLIADLQRPRLAARGTALPEIPAGGVAEIRFSAGFGANWAEVPVDLAQAVLLLAAQYYECRQAGGAEVSAMSFGVMALIERWRTVRMIGGRA
ncbi:hypothetical protein DW2_03484 [Thioclava atlantica]|uniref:Gene transfer agent protein n=2 Tax=Thioclava atlantica TaxID=1317124 RepID=A0A085U042_9RHOB|nr:hypothetical protein DW2_03484 [Thioclava atlantica]